MLYVISAQCFPVYRTYVSESKKATSEEEAFVHGTAAQVLGHAQHTRDIEESIVNFITHALLTHPLQSEAHRVFVAKFQQLTGPAMAKGLEV